MLSTSAHLLLPRPLYLAMLNHAQTELPNECCGLFAGVREADAWRVKAIHPLVNEAASPREYHSAPFQAEKACRAAGHEFLAIYHSHPTSPPIPSKTDLERNFYGTSVMHLIIGLSEETPLVRGWWLLEASFEEADWRIVESDDPSLSAKRGDQ